MNTSGDFQYMGGYHEYIRRYFISTSGDIMMHVGEQGDESLSILH